MCFGAGARSGPTRGTRSLQTLSSRLTVLFLSLVVLPSAALSIVSLVAIRTEHQQILAFEHERIAAAARRLAATLSLRLQAADRQVAAMLERAFVRGDGLEGLSRLVAVLDPERYRRWWVVDAQGRILQAGGAQGAKAAEPAGDRAPAFSEPVRAWLQAPREGAQRYWVESRAGGPRRWLYAVRLGRGAPPQRLVAAVLFEVDVRRALAQEVEALVSLVGDREQARFVIVPAHRPDSASNERGATARRLARHVLSPPYDHLALEVRSVTTPPEGALEALSKRLHVWAIVFILCGLLVGASVTTLAVHREMKAAALKSDFVTTVTHELKTPLTSIGMFAETLLMGRVRDEAEQRECLEIIARETERLSRLIDRVLTFSKIEAQKKRFDLRLTDLRALVEETVALFRTQMRTAPEPVDIEVVELAELPPVLCDRAALQEVLLNLFSNAYKYSRWRRSDPGASSSGESGEHDSDQLPPRRIRVTVTKRRRWAMIAVRDWGVGISRSEQRKIFRKFYRANDVLTRDVEGSGIGLSLARSIMRAHRGDITVRSRLGQGSTFTLWLPR